MRLLSLSFRNLKGGFFFLVAESFVVSCFITHVWDEWLVIKGKKGKAIGFSRDNLNYVCFD